MTSPAISRSIAAGLAALLWLAAGPVSANGRFPAARFLTLDNSTIALATTFGLVSSADGGRTWHFTCEEALGFDSTLRWDTALGISGSGVAVGLPDGLSVGSASGCAVFTRPPSAPINAVIDLAADGRRLAAAIAPVGAPNGIVLSDDGGTTWRAGWSRPSFSIATVDLVPGNARRLYASGDLAGPPVLLRSDDGGATFTASLATFPDSVFLYLAGVDPQNADRIFARSDLRSGGTALLRSDDGGGTFRELRRTANPMTGFAFAASATTLWSASPGANPNDGIFRSTDGGNTWQRVSGGYTTLCLRHHDGILYMCADGFRDPFALGCSTDGGATWRALMAWEDLRGPDTCPAGAGRDRCQGTWAALRSQLVRDGGTSTEPRGCFLPAPDAGADAPVIPADALLTSDAEVLHAGGGGCACRVGSAPGAALPLIVLLVIGLTCRRARAAHPFRREGAPWPRIRTGG